MSGDLIQSIEIPEPLDGDPPLGFIEQALDLDPDLRPSATEICDALAVLGSPQTSLQDESQLHEYRTSLLYIISFFI